MSLCRSFGLYIIHLRCLPIGLRVNHFHHWHFSFIITFYCFRFILFCLRQWTFAQTNPFHCLWQGFTCHTYFQFNLIHHFIQIILCHTYPKGGSTLLTFTLPPLKNRYWDFCINSIIGIQIFLEIISGRRVTPVYSHIKLRFELRIIQLFRTLGHTNPVISHLNFRTCHTGRQPCRIIDNHHRYLWIQFRMMFQPDTNHRIQCHPPCFKITLCLEQLVLRFVQFYFRHQ